MHCSTVRRQLSALLDHELDEPRVAAVRAHLAVCAECRGVLHQYRVQQSLLADALRSAPYLPVAERVITLARSEKRWARGARSSGAPHVASRLLSAAALVALAAFVGLSAMAIRDMGREHGVTPTAAAFAVAAGPASPAGQSTPRVLVSTMTTAAATPLTTVPSQSAPSELQAPDPTWQNLQSAAGFQLFAPTNLPDGFTLAAPRAPMQLPGFVSVVVEYRNRDGSLAFTLTEASPYQESRDTMPSDVWDAAFPVDLGDGRSGRLYDDGRGGLQLWWQEGKTSIRLESNELSRDALLNVAKSVKPLAPSSAESPTPRATPTTGDQAIALARRLIGSLGGDIEATVSSQRLTTLSEPAATGLPLPDGHDGTTLVWLLEFDNALNPPGCPAVGTSVCAHGQLTVVVDANQPAVLGWHGDDGVWKRP